MSSYIRKNFKEKDVLAEKKAAVTICLRSKGDDRVRDANIMKRMYQERSEIKMEESLARAQESAGWKAEELKREERLAYYMDQAKKDEIKELKLKQLLSESREIGELRKTLKLAYHQKELYNREERDRLKHIQLDKAEEECLKRQMEKDRLLRVSFERTFAEAQAKKKLMYKEALQDQMIDNHKLKILEQQKRLKETALVNDAVRTAMEEDERVEEQIQMHKEHVRQEIECFQKAKEFWARREKELEEEEDRKLVQYLEMQNQRERQLQQKNLQKEDVKLKQQVAVIERVKQLEGFRQERERIAEILLNEETRIKNEKEEKEKIEESNRFKRESRQVFLAQLQFKLAQKEEEKRMDQIYALQLLETAEKERQIDSEKLRQAKLQKLKYGEELRNGLEELNRRKFNEILLAIKDEEGLEAEREKHMCLVNEERRRLINEHIPHLVGFLPAGTIRDDDVPYLKPELRDMLNVQNPITDFK